MDIAKYIDHTLLKPNTTQNQIKNIINEALKYRFYAICIPPIFTKFAYTLLKGTEIKLCVVNGFPLGNTFLSARLREAELSINNGAEEIDTVLNTGLIKEKMFKKASLEIQQMISIVHPDKILKVIIETPILTNEEIVTFTKIILDSGADYIKTATGFFGHTRQEVVGLIHQRFPDIKIKAAGGIRTYQNAIDMLNAGASRIGTSTGINIMKSIA